MNEVPSIRILSAGAPKTGVGLCADAWSQKTATPFEIEFATAPMIRERVGMDAAGADIIVAPASDMEHFVAAGAIVDGSPVAIGKIAAGVVIRNGAVEPDLSSAETLRDALLAADCIVYNQASSGRYIEEMIGTLGIAAQLADRTVRVANGAAVMEQLAGDRRNRSIGFGQVTEIRLHEPIGVHLAGPLPAEIGRVTAYAAGLSSSAAGNQNAATLLAFMASHEGRAILAKAGVE